MEQIRFVLERFFYGWKMNAFVFNQEDQILDFYMGTKEKVSSEFKEELSDIFSVDEKNIYITIKKKACEAGIPVIYMDEDGIYYLAFTDKENRLFLFGPASAEELSFAQQIAYRKRHQVRNQKYLVPKVSLAKSLNGVALIYYTLTGNQVAEKDIMRISEIETNVNSTTSDMMIYEIQNTTEEKQHLAYQDELKWVAQIENGTLEAKENRMTPENLAKLEQIGTLASANSLKQFEYLAVTSTCLASRAAIRGGVNAYEAYRLSEVFLQKISKCTNAMEMLQIHSQVAGEFAKQVRIARENRNFDCVEQCKDYIARHRTKKFSLEDVAEAVGKNPSYLSRIFSVQTGITMQEYALDIRLEAAANILIYSNEGIGDISEYLHFPSQSYFGERFKKKYGVTPANYRKQHKIRDFKE